MNHKWKKQKFNWKVFLLIVAMKAIAICINGYNHGEGSYSGQFSVLIICL